MISAGGINSLGFELAGVWTVALAFRSSGSLAFKRSRYTQDIADPGEVGGSLRVEGNDTVMVPRPRPSPSGSTSIPNRC